MTTEFCRESLEYEITLRGTEEPDNKPYLLSPILQKEMWFVIMYKTKKRCVGGAAPEVYLVWLGPFVSVCAGARRCPCLFETPLSVFPFPLSEELPQNTLGMGSRCPDC